MKNHCCFPGNRRKCVRIFLLDFNAKRFFRRKNFIRFKKNASLAARRFNDDIRRDIFCFENLHHFFCKDSGRLEVPEFFLLFHFKPTYVLLELRPLQK